MIESILLKSGRSASAANTQVKLTPITVFVGPNNSGKSKVLAEIAALCGTGVIDKFSILLDDLMFEQVSNEEEALRRASLAPDFGEQVLVSETTIRSSNGRRQVPIDELRDVIRNDFAKRRDYYCSWFLCSQMLVLDGRNRIDLVNEQPAGDLQNCAQSSFQVLVRDEERRQKVRKIVFEAVGSYLVIDPTKSGVLRARLARREPEDEIEELGLHSKAVKFHAEVELIETASDGVKAFVGVVTEIVAGDPKILLIDEPEAFLHPPLASQLGYEISSEGTSADKRVFVSTHSPSFVMGCVQSGVPLNIIRLTYRNGVATSRVLSSKNLLQLIRNPLLRSTGLLNGLFYEFVVVTESDTDRAFYQEINERLLRFKPDWGIPNCLFLNAQNKQTVKTIVEPLRELGIPTVGVVDIDVLKDGG